MQVWHTLQHRERRNKCSIMKGCFFSSFESKGCGLPAGLQSSSKAARHVSFWVGISSSSWVLSVCSCIPPHPNFSVSRGPSIDMPATASTRKSQIVKPPIPWHWTEKRQPLPRPGIRIDNFSPVFANPRRLRRPRRVCACLREMRF